MSRIQNLNHNQNGDISMRTITLHDGTVKKYREACDAIERVREKDPQKAEEMEKSLGESCKVLMRILMKSDLEEEYE